MGRCRAYGARNGTRHRYRACRSQANRYNRDTLAVKSPKPSFRFDEEIDFRATIGPMNQWKPLTVIAGFCLTVVACGGGSSTRNTVPANIPKKSPQALYGEVHVIQDFIR